MTHDTKPLEEDVLTALRTALPLSDAPSDARARILSTVESRIAMLPKGPGGGGGGPAGGAGGSAASAAPGPSPGGWFATHPVVAMSAALVVGGALGALLRGASPTERIVYVDRIVAASAPPPLAVAASATLAATSRAVPVESLPLAAAPIAPAAPADSGQQLAAESALLDAARTALSRGEAVPALDAIGRHGSQFPHGMLSEEREALAVKALLLGGRDAEARLRAARFRERYPQSLFLPALDAKLNALR